MSENWNERADPQYGLDMALVKGQNLLSAPLGIAASGSHNILMSGPPGSGKTAGRTLPSIYRASPLMKLEVTKIYSVAGLLQQNFIRERPFRSPHHTISGVALVGGGKFPGPEKFRCRTAGFCF